LSFGCSFAFTARRKASDRFEADWKERSDGPHKEQGAANMKIPWLIPILVVGTMTTLALAQADDSNPNRSVDVTTIAPDSPAAEQTEYLTSRTYELAIIRLQFFATLHQITEINLSKESTTGKADEQIPADQGSEDTLVVAPPGSSPNIPESLAKYLELTPVQIATIEAHIAEEQRQTQPLLQQLSHNREALTIATHAKHSTNTNRYIRRLDVEQSHILERLADANLRLQRDIYKILTDAQRERLDDIGQHIADVIQQWFVGR
jgi:hypothetical protein